MLTRRTLLQIVSLVFRFALAAATIAAVGCSSITTLGVSEESGKGDAAPTLEDATGASREARAPSMIVTGQGEFLSLTSPKLGDIDGDGFDDFVLASSLSNEAPFSSDDSLFYGRPEYPAQLDVDEADAVFESFNTPTTLGDINCDGLADFAVQHGRDWEIVFGDRTRWSGRQVPFSQKVIWRSPPSEPGFGGFGLREVGDVDGDGCDELVVSDEHLAPDDEIASRPNGFIHNDYLVAGRADGWPSGVWDPSWAIAQFGDEAPVNDGPNRLVVRRLTFRQGGDLDGDGYADLVARGNTSLLVYYGSADGLRGTLEASAAAATLDWPLDNGKIDLDKIPFLTGDVDGDGTADFQFPGAAQLGIQYGTKQRWSGNVMLQPDLTFEGNNLLWLSSVGDIDGDTAPEIAIVELDQDSSGGGELPTISATLFLTSAAAEHATGTYTLGDADIFHPSATDWVPGGVDTNIVVQFAGDLDGDGSDDLLYAASDPGDFANPPSNVYLLPGTPRAPD